MLRKILMLCPVLAFALPLVADGPALARPLAPRPAGGVVQGR
ncbi:hypothetical protein OV079_32705 [Nannocystis pusilla]|uniref:Uncharacterized protein n=1 Tax=Nannocystis pusilla TaxID=889268 RepID=A0A9X3EU00_9BACT|nr:hypothetical protein [Nannocystis pusilla]MCY1010247.1 hypothetical protein [Nannocystis pusilla]